MCLGDARRTYRHEHRYGQGARDGENRAQQHDNRDAGQARPDDLPTCEPEGTECPVIVGLYELLAGDRLAEHEHERDRHEPSERVQRNRQRHDRSLNTLGDLLEIHDEGSERERILRCKVGHLLLEGRDVRAGAQT